MIRKVFKVKKYWKVIVYYNIDYDFFYTIADNLKDIHIPLRTIDGIYDEMIVHKAKAFTCSNTEKHVSVLGFNKHSTMYDYLNSIVHEAEHIKQDMLYAYKVEDSGEPPAYTIGYLVMKMIM